MGKSLREFVDSVIFAGLNPASRASEHKPAGWYGRLRGRVDRWINGVAPDDPFYLTNRSWGQRIRVWLLLGLPCVVLGCVVGFALMGRVESRQKTPAEAPAPSVTAKMLPDLDRDYGLTNHDLEVVEVSVQQSPTGRIKGVVRNRTGREIRGAELVFDLTDYHGSSTGAVKVAIGRVPANGTAAFEQSISHPAAVLALIREVRTAE